MKDKGSTSNTRGSLPFAWTHLCLNYANNVVLRHERNWVQTFNIIRNSEITILVRVVPELIRGGGWAPPEFFLNG